MTFINNCINKFKYNLIIYISILFDTAGYSMWMKNNDGEWIYYNND